MQADLNLHFSPVDSTSAKIAWKVRPWTYHKDIQADPELYFSPVDSTTANILFMNIEGLEQGQSVCARPSLFHSSFYNSKDSFHVQWRPEADYKDMQADQDFFSLQESTTAKILSMNSEGPRADYKDMQTD